MDTENYKYNISTHHVWMLVKRKTIWRNISIPAELVEEIEGLKPGYMSIAEFVRLASRFYIDHYMAGNLPELKTEEAPIVEQA